MSRLPKRVWSGKKLVFSGKKAVREKGGQIGVYKPQFEEIESGEVYTNKRETLDPEAPLDVYDSSKPEYIGTIEGGILATYTFYDYDGTVLKQDTCKDGETPIPPENPTRSGYEFIGWNPEVGPITKDVDYTAEYESIAPTDPGIKARKEGESIKFLDSNNDVIVSLNYYFGAPYLNDISIGNSSIYTGLNDSYFGYDAPFFQTFELDPDYGGDPHVATNLGLTDFINGTFTGNYNGSVDSQLQILLDQFFRNPTTNAEEVSTLKNYVRDPNLPDLLIDWKIPFNVKALDYSNNGEQRFVLEIRDFNGDIIVSFDYDYQGSVCYTCSAGASPLASSLTETDLNNLLTIFNPSNNVNVWNNLNLNGLTSYQFFAGRETDGVLEDTLSESLKAWLNDTSIGLNEVEDLVWDDSGVYTLINWDYKLAVTFSLNEPSHGTIIVNNQVDIPYILVSPNSVVQFTSAKEIRIGPNAFDMNNIILCALNTTLWEISGVTSSVLGDLITNRRYNITEEQDFEFVLSQVETVEITLDNSNCSTEVNEVSGDGPVTVPKGSVNNFEYLDYGTKVRFRLGDYLLDFIGNTGYTSNGEFRVNGNQIGSPYYFNEDSLLYAGWDPIGIDLHYINAPTLDGLLIGYPAGDNQIITDAPFPYIQLEVAWDPNNPNDISQAGVNVTVGKITDNTTKQALETIFNSVSASVLYDNIEWINQNWGPGAGPLDTTLDTLIQNVVEDPTDQTNINDAINFVTNGSNHWYYIS